MSDEVDRYLLEGVEQLREVVRSVEQEVTEQGARLTAVAAVVSENAETLHRGSGGREALTTRITLLEDRLRRLEKAHRGSRGASEKPENELAKVEDIRGRWKTVGLVLTTMSPGIVALLTQHC